MWNSLRTRLHTHTHMPTHTLTNRTLGGWLRPTERAVLVHETGPAWTESLQGEAQRQRGGGCHESEQTSSERAEGREQERVRVCRERREKEELPTAPPRKAQEKGGLSLGNCFEPLPLP